MAQVQVKRHQRNKRDYTEISEDNDNSSEPKRKKQKIDSKKPSESQDKDDTKNKTWICQQCTLVNDPTAKKCAVCGIPKNYKFKDDKITEDKGKAEADAEAEEIEDEEDEYIDDENDALFESDGNSKNKNKNKNSLSRNDSAISWGDDEDIDLDNFDGQQIFSIDNKDVASRINGSHNSNNSSSSTTSDTIKTTVSKQKKKESTLNGLEYTECWLCTNCFAMNRLLDTLSRYQMKCAFCHRATYTPTTEIIKSFEWDQQQQAPPPQTLPTAAGRGGVYTQRNSKDDSNTSQQEIMLREYERKKKKRYMTKHIKNREGDILISGMINQNKVNKLATIDLIPEEVIRLCLLFYGEFNFDGFDTLTNAEDFEVSKGLTTCTRTTKDDGQWRNCFGMKICSMINNGKKESVKFEWKLRCNKRRNKDWEDEPVESVIIGVIEAKGIQSNMGSAFTSYHDGWGLLGDGQKVTEMEYKKFNAGFHHSAEIVVTLQYIKHPWSDEKNECILKFNNKMAYELNATKKYKLAIAMNSREYEVEWVGFDKTKDGQEPIQQS